MTVYQIEKILNTISEDIRWKLRLEHDASPVYQVCAKHRSGKMVKTSVRRREFTNAKDILIAALVIIQIAGWNESSGNERG